MDSLSTSVLLSLLLLLLLGGGGGLGLMLRRGHTLRLRLLSVEERLQAREQELLGLHERLQQGSTERDGLQRELQQRGEELARLQTSLELERRQFDEKLKLLQDSRAELTASFKNLANDIFEEKTKKFSDSNKESLNLILSPLKDKISQFEKRVEETYDRESKERFTLHKEIRNLQELNARISDEATNLTKALKGDNKAQGNWGEVVLESILEKSGLVKGREYDVQMSLKSEDGNKLQPDVVVHLPESRDIIIDSKVSLKAWDEYNSTEDPARQAELLKQHCQSLRLHVRNLSNKDYQNLVGVNSLDYVFLFMPIEAAFFAATRNEPDLVQDAFERNIIIVVPSTLLTTLKTVQNLWRLAQQSQNANEIAKKAGDLYDKFVAFVGDLEEVGQRIDSSRRSYEKAHNKLVSGRGNLVRRTEMLRELGAKTSKSLGAEMVAAADEDGEENDGRKALGEESEGGAKDGERDDETRH